MLIFTEEFLFVCLWSRFILNNCYTSLILLDYMCKVCKNLEPNEKIWRKLKFVIQFNLIIWTWSHKFIWKWLPNNENPHKTYLVKFLIPFLHACFTRCRIFFDDISSNFQYELVVMLVVVYMRSIDWKRFLDYFTSWIQSIKNKKWMQWMMMPWRHSHVNWWHWKWKLFANAVKQIIVEPAVVVKSKKVKNEPIKILWRNLQWSRQDCGQCHIQNCLRTRRWRFLCKVVAYKYWCWSYFSRWSLFLWAKKIRK